MARRVLTTYFAFMLSTSQCIAMTEKDISVFDLNKDGRLSGNEISAYEATKNDPILAKYDANHDGKLEKNEKAKLLKDLDEKYSGRPKASTDTNKTDTASRVRQALKQYNAATPGIPIRSIADPEKATPDPCGTKPTIYIRRDKLDTFVYEIPDVAKAQGASVSLTSDFTAKSRSATIDGFVAVPFLRDLCAEGDDPKPGARVSAYAFAPWVEGHGTLSSKTPRTTKTERSVLSAGLDAQLELRGLPIFPHNYLSATPYVFTDFRGSGRGEGLTARWEPHSMNLHLGSYRRDTDMLFNWYWRVIAQADIKHVDQVGLTNLTKTTYAWWGGTAKLYVDFFPNENVSELIRNRFHLTATFNGFYNSFSRSNVRDYQVQLAYDLTKDGSTSISVEYDRGTPKDTLVSIKQLLLRLNYKY